MPECVPQTRKGPYSNLTPAQAGVWGGEDGGGEAIIQE